MNPNIRTSKKALLETSANYLNAGPSRDDTTLASFQLCELEKFIASIKESREYQKLSAEVNGDISHTTTHLVCIRLVREKIGKQSDLVLYGPQHYHTLKENAPKFQSASPELPAFSQLVPLITGCVRKFSTYDVEHSFEDITDDQGNIIVLRPGGEGTGLIPPPKTGT